MKKCCLNKPLSYLLLVAFLALQWSATHIHLVADHAHGGDQHQHAAAAHQHQTASDHADAIDVADDRLSHVDASKVVELDHDCTQLKAEQSTQFAALPASYWNRLVTQRNVVRRSYPRKLDNYQSYYQYSLIRLRAPPVFS